MSNNKQKDQKKYLLITLFILLSIYVVIKFSNKKESNIPSNLIDINISDIDKIEIKIKNNNTNILKKVENNSWVVYDLNKSDDTYNIKNKDIEDVFNSLKKIKPVELISLDTNNMSKYSVSDETGNRLKLYDKNNKILADFFVGSYQLKQGFQGSYPTNSDIITYVKKSDDNKIFGVYGFLYNFDKKIDDWKDKTIFNFKLDDVNYINFKSNNKSFELVKKDSLWKINEKIADIEIVKELLNKLSNYYVFEISSQKWLDDFENEIKIKTISGEENILKIHKISDENFILKSNINKIYFKYSNKSIIEDFFKSEDFFVKK